MRSPTPAVSVIMATYNGAATIAASINSVLSQTMPDFELIVVDDGSTDGTQAVLATYDDPRLVILRNETNLGIVGSRNRCLDMARGAFTAMLDHDDLSAPTRLARQLAYFKAYPDTVILGTAARVLQDGDLLPMIHPAVTTPGLIAWLLHIANPLVCSSIMFRTDAARSLGVFMRPQFTYADDYDFIHRITAAGPAARLDQPLTIYRLHEGNTFKKHQQTMAESAALVLEQSYSKWFGDGALAASRLVVRHLSAAQPIPDLATLHQLRDVFERVNNEFLSRQDMDAPTRKLLVQHGSVLWRRMLNGTSLQSNIGAADLLQAVPAVFTPTALDRASLAANRLPLRKLGRAALNSLRRGRASPISHSMPVPRFGLRYAPAPPSIDTPPTLFVVVDTEAEFDWNKPFSRDLTSVTAMDNIEQGQAIFDAYGLRPIYVIDYPVATQERGHRKLRAILARDGCEIGAHLHPWTNPPFEEMLSPRNSYPGNLPAELEERKLANLTAAIKESFGIVPRFYRAGRYGFGPATAAALARQNITIDLSVLPGADLRAKGGPDFTGLQPFPYRLLGTGITTYPMTRADIGRLPSLARLGQAVHRLPGGGYIHAPSLLARLGIAETVTLTPEGVTADEQIRLLRTMLKRGYRQFFLHYHSPSLGPGNTHYVRDHQDVARLLDGLRDVCRFFFEELGGLPGYPKDLLRGAGQGGAFSREASEIAPGNAPAVSRTSPVSGVKP